MQRVATSAASVERIVAGGETVYGVNTGFGLLANTRIPERSPCRASDQPDPVAQRRPRRPAAAPCHPADDRPEAARPRPRLFGRSPAGDRGAAAAARCRRHAADPVAGQRRRQRRPCAAGAPDRRADGLRAHRLLRARSCPAAAALERLGLAAAAARPEGRPGADQRHAGQRGACARRLVPGRARVRRRDRRRRAVGRCAEGQRQAVRPAHFAAARPARPDPRRGRDPRPAPGQRDPDQPCRLQPGAGPLQLPLPAAGDGRLARPAAECGADADHRGRRRDRQPDRLRR